MKSNLNLRSYKFIYLDRRGNELEVRYYLDSFFNIRNARAYASRLLAENSLNAVKIKVRRIY